MVPDAPLLDQYGYDDYKAFNLPGPNAPADSPIPNALKFIEENKKKPFFINLWIHETHTPHYPKEQYLKQHIDLEEKKKKPCKPSKGKRFAKRVDGKCRSFGQSGQAKGGGDRIRPGTKKGDAYCARSAKIKKCKNPPCANDLSRKKWKCRGSKSMKEGEQ